MARHAVAVAAALPAALPAALLLPALLATAAALLLQGCGGGDPGGDPGDGGAATTTTSPRPAFGNTWCASTAAALGKPLDDPDEPEPPGRAIGWHPTNKKVGVGGFCEVGVPAADWHLSYYCSPSPPPRVAVREGFSVERFLGGATDAAPAAAVRIKVLTYNLGAERGRGGAAGKNIADHAKDEPFDFITFQECDNATGPLGDAKAAGMQGEYDIVHTYGGLSVAYRKDKFDFVSQGDAWAAQDAPDVAGNETNSRLVLWTRVRHKASQRTVFLANHQGPLPMNSGGLCGPEVTAYLLLKIVAESACLGDAVVLLGDFSAWSNDPSGRWMEEVGRIDCHLPHVLSSPTADDAWGSDNVFASCLKTVETHILPKGGSDRNPLAVVFEA